jgi:hypothetical protein
MIVFEIFIFDLEICYYLISPSLLVVDNFTGVDLFMWKVNYK